MNREILCTGEYRRLENLAADSKGSIHDDAAAQALGFRGAFVPGSVVGTKALLAATAALGYRWMESGHFHLTFVSPVYAGDEVREIAERTDRRVGVRVETREGRLCCTGIAGLGYETPWESGNRPKDVTVLPGVPVGTEFGEREFAIGRDEAVRLAKASSDPALWYNHRSPWGDPIAPPEALQRVALDLVRTRPLEVTGVRNPGMWAEHALALRGPIFVDRPYRMTEFVADKGRSGRTVFLTYEFRVTADGREVAVGRHKVKWLTAEEGV